MAKKKKAVIVVRAPKAVKRGPRHRSSNGMQATGNSRAVITSQTPRPYKKLRTVSEDVIEISGMELIAPVVTSQGPLANYFYLNPGNSQYFKSLSGEASAREKFRFKSLRLRYWTQAPSSRSGVISGVVLLDPLNSPPSDPQGFMAFSHSFTRAISLDGASVPHRIVDQKWYYVANESTTVNSTDPTTRYQGLVAWQSQGAASADAGLISGYIGLEYVCELMGQRPSKNLVLAATPLDGQLFTGGGSGPNQYISYDTVPNAVGAYDLQIEGQTVDASGHPTKKVLAPGYSSVVTTSDSFLSYLGKHAINYLLPLGVSAVDGKSIENDRGFVPRPLVSLYRTLKGNWACEVGGAQVDIVPNWADVHILDTENEEKSGVLPGPLKVKELLSGSEYRLRGNAAGDITVNLYSMKPDGASFTTLATNLTSSGTGAVALRYSLTFTETTPAARLVMNIQPTGVENRQIVSAASAMMVYSEAAGDENLI